MKELFITIKEQIEALEKDVNKTAAGNKAAGVRLRKQIKELQNLLKNLRSDSLNKE